MEDCGPSRWSRMVYEGVGLGNKYKRNRTLLREKEARAIKERRKKERKGERETKDMKRGGVVWLVGGRGPALFFVVFFCSLVLGEGAHLEPLLQQDVVDGVILRADCLQDLIRLEHKTDMAEPLLLGLVQCHDPNRLSHSQQVVEF